MQKAFEELYEALDGVVEMGRFNPAVIQAMVDNKDSIISWIQSSAFQEKYAKHPYPPLMNPEMINYEKMPPRLAWELNLPLPYIDMVFLRSHGCGSTGLTAFLKKCGGVEIYCEEFYDVDARDLYVSAFTRIINAKAAGGGAFIYLLVSDYAFRGDYQKYFALIPQKPAINLVRDPVEMLKNYICHRRQVDFGNLFNLTCSPSEVLKNRVGYGFFMNIKSLPVVDSLPFWIHDKMMCFHDSQLIKSCINIKDIYQIDMKEIIGDKARDTMVKLAKYFKIKIPKDCDKEFFARRVADFQFLLPLTLYVHPLDFQKLKQGFTNDLSSCNLKGGIPITITTCYEEQKDKKDITKIFFKESINPVVILVEEQYIQELSQNVNLQKLLKEYLGQFVKALFAKKEEERAKILTPDDILEYFQNRKFLRRKFEQALEQHLEYLQQKRPDIIKSWKYYAKFKAMCAEDKSDMK